MNREDIKKLALDLAKDLQAVCHKEPDPSAAEEILQMAANANSWRDLVRQYCRTRKSSDKKGFPLPPRGERGE